jgi:hypothetical protein
VYVHGRDHEILESYSLGKVWTVFGFPLKKPPTFDLILRDSIELAFKDAVLAGSKTLDKDIPKKSK